MSELPKEKPVNPAFRAMGLPNLRAKLPSRNWTIFLTVVGTFSGFLYYDRHQTKLIKARYQSLVSHLAEEPLSPLDYPRKVTVYLISPPGDGIVPAREHFRDYIKPILNAAALDFDVVEGREVGQLRAKVAAGVRRRRMEGLPMSTHGDDGGEGGVVCVGRQSWKEWVRGVQEGWLGPLTEPMPPVTEKVAEAAETVKEVVVETLDNAIKPEEEKKEEEKKKEEPPKPLFPAEFITPAEYAAAALPPNIPETMPPAGVISFPHILGFRNTFIRLYRFLHRREMAEEVCREAAAVALGYYRPFIREIPSPDGVMKEETQVEQVLEGDHATQELREENTEIERALKHEEGEWIKKVWKDEEYKGVWTEKMTVDERIRERMKRFYLRTEDVMQVEKMKEEEDFFGRKKEKKEEEEQSNEVKQEKE
ncbi:hypothetical protein EX30DRAFT_337159 [Ascodesmis nigricans]|uniref:Mitochondrial import inner membrane translocase subunit TIM54 n=1 Tax=Ascodesmis nigricans TaxID=341454 RepID=A0A4S2N5S9_9PEZI|nr:hypothetical protein EX30DRAFT_337159 [Ascodesmis nigricans]